MLKKLRQKMICIMMTIVAVMLVVIFGLVLTFMNIGLDMQSDRMLQSLGENPLVLDSFGPATNNVRLPYFTVQLHRGEVIATSGGSYDLSDEELVLEITKAALRAEEQSGELEQYGFKYLKISRKGVDGIIFLDISSQKETMDDLLVSCAIISLLSLGVFFVLSCLLARWAVKPVEQAWQQQRQFVADASHELKTPLSVILTNAELLRDNAGDEVMQKQNLDHILTMSVQMRVLVEGLLELARMDNGSVKTKLEPTDLSRLTAETVLPFEPLYFEKGLELYSDIAEGISVMGSAQYLRQVVEILLDNAQKYSAEHGQVCLSLSRQGNHCILSVASPGEAISREDLTNIFKRFYRVDKARSRDGSYGLGLSIAQSIVDAHGGRIWAQSENGCNTFFVQLPTQS